MTSKRRQFLRLVGLAGAGLLAGCDGDGSTGDPTQSATPMDSTPTGSTPSPTAEDTGMVGEVGGTLSPSAGDTDARFGSAVDISAAGTRVLVGAPGETRDGRSVGAAYLFDREGGAWQATARLGGEAIADAEHLGRAVSLAGDRALVGATGLAVVFERDGGEWAQQQVLRLEDATAERTDAFGAATGFDGERALVGAPAVDGAAYVFEQSSGGWERTATLLPGGGDTAARFAALSTGSGSAGARDWAQERMRGATQQRAGRFGRTLDLDGDLALVGALDAQEPAILFERTDDGWERRMTLAPGSDAVTAGTASVEPVDATFARAQLARGTLDVALAGGTALVGGRFPEGLVAAFSETDGTWERTGTLVPSDADPGNFGCAVALSGGGESALVGAETATTADGDAAGLTYLFERADGWTQQTTVRANEGAPDDQFGSAVALAAEDSIGVVGAPGAGTSNGTATGSATIVE